MSSISAVYSSSSTCQALTEVDSHLSWASAFCGCQHGEQNPYISWLLTLQELSRDQAIRFLCTWYPVSRHQPQVLLAVAAAFDDWEDRRKIFPNYVEEDGLAHPDHEPHYSLLEHLISKVGGRLQMNPRSELMARAFRRNLGNMSEPFAKGILAGVEHPALDISAMLHHILRLAGFSHLLSTDPYTVIHVTVERDHIADSHEMARLAMYESETEVLAGFHKAMEFWSTFFPLIFKELGFRA